MIRPGEAHGSTRDMRSSEETVEREHKRAAAEWWMERESYKATTTQIYDDLTRTDSKVPSACVPSLILFLCFIYKQMRTTGLNE